MIQPNQRAWRISMAKRRRVIQAEPDRHLQEHLEATAGRIDSFAAVDGHDFFVHFRFARIVHLVFFIAFLNGFNFRADALHLHGGFVAGDAQREQQHIDDQGENDDGPAPVGNVVVQPLEGVEERVGDELHPAEIYEAVKRRIHVLQFVVIFGADVNAQCESLRAACGGDLWNRLGSLAGR